MMEAMKEDNLVFVNEVTNKDLELAGTLLDLPFLITHDCSTSRFAYSFEPKKRRTVLDNPPPPRNQVEPPLAAVKPPSLNRNISPDNPFSLQGSDLDFTSTPTHSLDLDLDLDLKIGPSSFMQDHEPFISHDDRFISNPMDMHFPNQQLTQLGPLGFDLNVSVEEMDAMRRAEARGARESRKQIIQRKRKTRGK